MFRKMLHYLSGETRLTKRFNKYLQGMCHYELYEIIMAFFDSVYVMCR